MFIKIYEKIKNYIKENYKFLISVIVIILIGVVKLPFVVYAPGGIINLNERIEVDNSYEEEGSFNMSYVTFYKGKIPILLLSYLFKDWDILPASDVTREDQSVDELFVMEKLYMTSALDNATILAYQTAGKNILIKKNINNVIYISDEANTDIKLYDQVIQINGISVENIDDVKNVVNEYKEGDTLTVTVKRNDELVNTKATIYNTSDGLKMGIMFLTTYEYEADPKIKITTEDGEAGSSGGLMLALEIYNKLVEDDITHGKKIVGTGTIDIDGIVGAIDGVKYKVLGAAKNGADIFLCPEENYEEALKIKEERNLDLIIKSVHTFDEALTYLDTLK